MRSKNTIKANPVQVSSVWLPCEYLESPKYGVFILSLGDVDRDRPDNGIAYVKKSLSDAALDFLRQISDSRKLVVLVPETDMEQDDWPCRQMLKRELRLPLDATERQEEGSCASN